MSDQGASRQAVQNGLRGIMQPHRLVMLGLALLLVWWCVTALRWDWLPEYLPLMVQGVWTTIWILVVTMVLGMLLAIPLGLAQAAGPWYLAKPAALVLHDHPRHAAAAATLAALLRARVALPAIPMDPAKLTSGRSCGRPGPMPCWP